MSADVVLNIYNLNGQLVRRLVNKEYPAGSHSITFDGKDDYGYLFASGIYVYRLTVGEYSLENRMILLK